ncbi:SusC/RagA family TonB-linked outer membrane protein [Capnocytophaga catalasegens]|uniref:SusC/RagA family TonB-linked outer membrane protein n=1 Tax=Capnocytophaga catalasegens TaxID=1004260 RepID=A0AAV5AW66_9FLAO|nr:SusC/RagA family TonB-linked outer membrane protein [Capnocytophaga catalasegens]GJM50784.1 SusC/RagA family TonB-linked outer membrane protein [Capnocytophaga catalasegens]GJM51937.1 SusC/RagA family TonB-linked outer membrane protein [Capnocytophaga catalasegens]
MVSMLKNLKTKGVKWILLALLSHGFWTVSAFDKVENLRRSSDYITQQQTKKVTGTVTDEKGESLPGVNIVVKGTSVGVTTDFNGNFEINVPSDKTELVFSYIGFKDQVISVTQSRSGLKVILKEEVQQIEGTVVTALGIKRQEKALSYNVQQVKSDELTRVKDANFVNSLNGKVAGVNIQRSASGVGGATKVVMRGAKSIKGDNNVLYVVDGVPIGNQVNREGDGSGFGGRTSGEGISDFNSEDIESISVLTGPAAAALYGASAANGVIVINTKKGSEGKLKINVSSSVEFLNPLILPEFQNTYGNVKGNYTSWGDKLSTPSSYEPKDFFNTGRTYNNAVNLSVGNKQNQTFASASSVVSEGVVPNNNYHRYNMSIRNTSSFLDDKLQLDLSANYIRQYERNMVSFGTYFNPIVGAYLYPRGENFEQEKYFERYDLDLGYARQHWSPGDFGMDIQNPYWIAYRNVRPQVKDRYMFMGQLKYNILGNLNVATRFRLDNTYTETEDKRYASTINTFAGSKGRYSYSQGIFRQKYLDIIANYNTTFATDYTLTANVGSSFEEYDTKSRGYGGQLLLLPNKFTYNNIDPTKASPFESGGNSRKRNVAIFASTELGWKSKLFLTLTGRTDYPSQLVNSKEEQIFYPSAGLSAVVTEFLSEDTKARLNPYLSYFKIRGSYTEVGSPIPFTGLTPGTTTREIEGGSVKAFKYYPLADFKAERTRSYEVGINSKWLNNKLSLDLTLYHSNTYNQLLEAKLPETSGYDFMFVQAGNIENRGLEMALGYRQDWGAFNFATNFTATTNRNKIVRLASGVQNPFNPAETFDLRDIQVGRFRLREGGQIGDMYDNKQIKRNQYGYVDFTGGVLLDEVTEPYKLGTINPDWLLGWQGNVGYKNISLSFLFKARLGGEVISGTQQVLDRYGVSKASADARDLGYVQVGDFRVGPKAYYDAISNLNSYYTYSATNVRLQEVSLTYNFDTKKLGKNLSNLSISVIGNNLWMIYNKAPFDPELAASTGTLGQGYDYFMLPSLTSYGLSVKMGF